MILFSERVRQSCGKPYDASIDVSSPAGWGSSSRMTLCATQVLSSEVDTGWRDANISLLQIRADSFPREIDKIPSGLNSHARWRGRSRTRGKWLAQSRSGQFHAFENLVAVHILDHCPAACDAWGASGSSSL